MTPEWVAGSGLGAEVEQFPEAAYGAGSMRRGGTTTAAIAATLILVGGAAASSALHHGSRAPRFVLKEAASSPDGRHVAWVKWFPKPNVGSIQVVTAGASIRTLYTSNNGCCTYLNWVSNRVLAFDDDYTVKLLALGQHHAKRVAGFSDFVLSPDHKAIVGVVGGGPREAQTVGVLAIGTSVCRYVPHPRGAVDGIAGFGSSPDQLLITRDLPNSHGYRETKLSVDMRALPRWKRPATNPCGN